jgi:ankyrin repeat protein
MALELLKHGADIEATTSNSSNTPLMEACSGRDLYPIILLLMKHGANILAQDVNQKTAYSAFLSNYDERAVEQLFVDVPFPLGTLREASYFLWFEMLRRQSSAVSQRVAALIKSYPELIAIQDCAGNTSLHVASRYGSEDTVKALLDGSCNVNAINFALETPAHLAATEMRSSILSLLNNRGAVFAKRDSKGDSVTDICEAMATEEALLSAAKVGDVDKITFCLEEKVNPNCTEWIDGGGDKAERKGRNNTKSPLFYAIDGGHTEAVRVLLSKGAKAEGLSYEGYSPLQYSIAHGKDPSIVRLLLEYKADASAKTEVSDSREFMRNLAVE